MSISTSIVSGHKIVYDPVGVGEICCLLGTNHADVGWVCSRGTLINKFAKYKPVIKANLLDTTGQLNGGTGANKNKWKSSATWWKGDDNKCGLTLTKRTTGSSLVTNWGTDWGYNPPTGGTAAPYRLIDFNYYDHNANVPLYVGYPTQYVINQSNNMNVVFQAYNGNDYALMLTDLTAGIWTSQAQMYCGVLVVYGTPNTSYENRTKLSVVHPTALGENLANYGKYTREVSVPYSLMPLITPCEIVIYPFLCQNAYANQKKGANEDVGWTYGVVACPVESATIETLTAWISGVLSNATCTYGQGGNSVQVVFNYDVTGHNGFSKDNVTPYLYILDNDIDTSGQYPDYEKKYGRHIISYGTATNNPKMGGTFGINVPDGVTRNYTQATLFENSSSYAVVGIDAASYVADYRTRHGSGAAKVTLVMELQDNNSAAYGSATLADVTISGTY